MVARAPSQGGFGNPYRRSKPFVDFLKLKAKVIGSTQPYDASVEIHSGLHASYVPFFCLEYLLLLYDLINKAISRLSAGDSSSRTCSIVLVLWSVGRL